MPTIGAIEVEEVQENGEVKDFPSLEEINKMREKRIGENLEKCSKELAALLEKYNARITWKTVVDDGRITENIMLLTPK